MARPKSYSNLILWQKAMALARLTYKLTEGLPKNESYGLVSQIRRAAVSVPSNVAEGHGRLTDSQFRQFLGNARGSLYEMQTQLELANDLGYLDPDSVQELKELGREVARLLNAFISSLGRDTTVKSHGRKAVDAITAANAPNSASSADPASSARP